MATTLTPGDIAIIGVNSDDPDAFAFVTLVDIEAGTEILFTDNGVFADGSFRATEGTVKYTTSGNVPAGSVVEFGGLVGDFTGESGSFALSASGDQVIAYQGTAAAPTFIFAVQTNSTAFQSTATTSNDSALPPGLTVGTTAVAVGSGPGAGDEVDNATYNESLATGTRAELLAAIADAGNWNGGNDRIDPLADGPFTVTDGGSTPSSVLINEFQPNPIGTDPSDSTIELFGTPGESFSGVIVSIESDSGTANPGDINSFDAISGTFDANGLLTVIIPDLENPSFTLALLDTFTGDTSTDIDTDDDGVADDLATFGTVFDAIGIPDAAADELLLYGGQLGGTDFAFTGTEPQLIFRDANDRDLFAINDPDNGQVFNVNAVDVTPAAFDADPTVPTFGQPNPGLVGVTGTTLAIAPTDAAKAEGDAGTTAFTFTVTRSGDTSGATSVDYAVTGGSADAADFGGALPNGTVDFAATETEQTITIDVSGDTDPELNETFSVTLANATGGATIATATAEGTIQNDDGVAITRIHAIQGPGAASPLDGQTVTIEGIVVGDFQGSSGLSGFYVQEEDADADGDPLTSEGIFVFDGSSPAVDVNEGDRVRVTGTVDEFFDLTELTSVSNVEVLDSGNLLPAAATVNFPVASEADLEAVEGMRVTIPDTLFVTEYFNLDRFGEVRLASDGPGNLPGSDGRLDQFTQFNAPDIAGFAAYQEQLATRQIVLDDASNVQNPDTLIFGRGSDPLSSANTLRGGDTVQNLSGILDFRFGDYRVQTDDGVDFQPTNPRPATPDDVGGTLTVASFNLLNFFTTLDVPGNPGSGPGALEPRGADSQAEFDRQLAKLVTTLQTIDADVLGLIELENEYGDQNGDGQFAIDVLVDALNDAVGADTYTFVDPGVPFGDTGDAITVGMIYKNATVEIADGTSIEILTDADLPGLGLSGTVFDGPNTNRAPLAVTFSEKASGEAFTVAVNHFKSKGGSGTGDDADIGDGQGAFNGTRGRAAEAVTTWLATDPTGSGDDDFLIIGDLNAYAQEDPIQILSGGGYTDLIGSFVGPQAYSFVFDGQIGTLDYALANESLFDQVTGATEWRINSDEPDALDYNLDFGRDPLLFDGTIPFRTSDHDPVIIGLDLGSPVNVIDGTRNDDILRGTPGDDLISGNNGDDLLIGLAGDDTIEGGRGGDIILGGDGDDVLAADRVDRFQDFDGTVSLVRGNAGDDTLIGGDKDDTLFGGADDDLLLGKNGDDFLGGGGGDDTLAGGGGDDQLRGNAGTDTADYSDLVITGVFGTVAGVDANLRAREAVHSSTNNPLAWTDRLFGIETVIGTDRNDRFLGDRQDNVFDGRGEVGRADRLTTFTDIGDGDVYQVTGDVVEYEGSRSQFVLTGTADAFTAAGPARDGTDTLIDIEFVKFDDGLFATADLFA